MRARKLTAVAATVLAVAGLSACRTNVGTAAVIGGHRFTESDVHRYLTAEGASPSVVAQADQNNQTLVPQSVVLNTLVQERIFALTLSNTTGGLPTDAQLNAAHDQAAATLSGQSITGAQLDSQVAATLGGEGLSQKLLPLVLRDIDLEYALILRVKATAPADLANAICHQHISVSINPAYGAWSATDFAVTPPSGTVVPAFLKLLTTPAATSTPTPTTSPVPPC